MQQQKLNSGKVYWASGWKMTAAAILAMGSFATASMAQQHVQKKFASAEEASNALVTAAQNNDEKAMLEILGPEGKRIVSSGDDVEDSEARANFVKKYQEMHRFMLEPDGTTTLYIGAENWPTPIPLVNKRNLWSFDTEAGKKEIVFRRVGENELSTIRVCEEFVAAEKEYRGAQHDEYAKKIFSDEGKHNGLYWKAGEGEPQSPIGPLVASAVVEGYANSGSGAPTPYRGYYFRVLTGQGKDSPGGAKSYIVNGKMTEGFALVAYPAEYRSSGVMTFIVGADGQVYEKDLGPRTEVLAKSMTEFDPNATWQKAEEEKEETASEQQSN